MESSCSTVFPVAKPRMIHPGGRGGSKKRAGSFSVLAAGWDVAPPQWNSRRISIWATDKTFQAIELLRAMHFDLALVRSQWACESHWRFVRRMRRISPDLKWALVAESLHGRDEVTARSMGAWRVMGHQSAGADDLEDMLFCMAMPLGVPVDAQGEAKAELEPVAIA